jgi:hypothetical protein
MSEAEGGAPIPRREFLAATAAATAARATSAADAPPQREVDVAVVGPGWPA